jgi:hypothetical protein
LGIPTEGYGFSNDAKAMLGPPSFPATSFPYDGQDMEQLPLRRARHGDDHQLALLSARFTNTKDFYDSYHHCTLSWGLVFTD